MSKFGLVIHLKNFKGDVQIEQNTVRNVMYNFDDVCALYDQQQTEVGQAYKTVIAKDWLSNSNFYAPNKDSQTLLLIPRQNDSLQLSSLIVIDNLHPSRSISIKGNRFSDAQMTNGLISVSQKTNVPIVTTTTIMTTFNVTVNGTSSASNSTSSSNSTAGQNSSTSATNTSISQINTTKTVTTTTAANSS